jgi:hypothetical protein
MMQATGDILGRDLHCKECGYNLRGLPHAGACPECGLSVERSLRGDLLRDSSPAYLRRLMRGLKLARWSATVLVVAPFLVVALTILAGSLALPVAVENVMFGALVAVVIVAPLLIAGGWWLISTPDPGLARSTEDHRRRAVRQTAAAFGGTLILVTMILLAKELTQAQLLTTLSEWLPALGTLVFAVHWLTGVTFIVRLAERVPLDVRLEARRVVMGFIIAVAAWVVSMVLGRGAAGVLNPAGLINLAAGLALLIAPIFTAIKYVGLLSQLEQAVREALLVATALEGTTTGEAATPAQAEQR